MEDVENIVMCPNCDEGLKGAISECPAAIFYVGDESQTPIDRYIHALTLGLIDVNQGCDCCIECQMDCRCDELVYDDDYYDDYYDEDEDDEPWDSGH